MKHLIFLSPWSNPWSNLNCFIRFFHLGLENEISYIRDGHENKNAIKYNLPIPFDVSQVVFTWQNLLGPFHLQRSEVMYARNDAGYLLLIIINYNYIVLLVINLYLLVDYLLIFYYQP